MKRYPIERVMRYLKRTMNLKFNYKRFSIVLERYINVYWNTLSYDSKTTSGYIFSIAGQIKEADYIDSVHYGVRNYSISDC
jgi:hypothetical protein